MSASNKDITDKLYLKLQEQNWQIALNKIEKHNLGIYQCNILAELYQKIISSYDFYSHVIHMANEPNVCGHAINLVQLKKNEYVIVDTWGQQEFLDLDSNTLSYFEFLELTHDLKFDNILIKTKNFYTKGKNNDLIEQDYYSIANNWIKTCQEFKKNNYYLDVYNDISYIQLSYPDTLFYKNILQILDTNYISNNYFDVDFLSTH